MAAEPTPNDAGMAAQLAQASQVLQEDRRRRRVRRGLLVSLFTVALLTLAAEAFLRITGDRDAAVEEGINRTLRRWVAVLQNGIFEEVDDPVRRYAMRPEASGEVDGWLFRVTSHRTRGAEFPAAKPPGEKRLLALGDSFCFGLWADEDETLVGHLARMASEREDELGTGITWRAVNLGVPGYNSGQQLRAFEQDGLGLEPDAVLLYYNTNDIDRHGFFLDEELGALRNDHLPLPTGLRRFLWKTSHLYGWIVRQHDRSLRSRPSAHLDPDVPWANTRADNKAATRESLARIAEICSERDLPLFFVNQPLWTWSGDARNPEWPVLPLVTWAAEVRDELGVPGIDLLGLLRGYADGVDRFAQDPANAPPPDLLVDAYVADESVELAFSEARRLAEEDGRSWETLGAPERMVFVGRASKLPHVTVPEIPDFHLSGEGYGHIARLTYPEMQAAGILP